MHGVPVHLQPGSRLPACRGLPALADAPSGSVWWFIERQALLDMPPKSPKAWTFDRPNEIALRNRPPALLSGPVPRSALARTDAVRPRYRMAEAGAVEGLRLRELGCSVGCRLATTAEKGRGEPAGRCIRVNDWPLHSCEWSAVLFKPSCCVPHWRRCACAPLAVSRRSLGAAPVVMSIHHSLELGAQRNVRTPVFPNH